MTVDIPVVFIISLLLIIIFGFWENYIKHHTLLPPIIDLGVFSRYEGKVTAILLLVLTAGMSVNVCQPLATCVVKLTCQGWVYLTTIWYQDLKHESPIKDVLHILTAPIVGIGACILVPILAPRVRAPILLVIGGFCTAAGNWLFAVEPVGMTYWICEFLSNIFQPFGADL